MDSNTNTIGSSAGFECTGHQKFNSGVCFGRPALPCWCLVKQQLTKPELGSLLRKCFQKLRVEIHFYSKRVLACKRIFWLVLLSFACVQDFGYFIPGHGGVTDRFDCQVVMGLFTFLYQRTFVPQIGEAEAAARLTAKQQRLQQQRQLLDAQEGNENKTHTNGHQQSHCATSHKTRIANLGEEDPALAAVLQAAQNLSLRELTLLRDRLEALAAARVAAGE